jgi:uncharacterized protein (TIGR03663 family)
MAPGLLAESAILILSALIRLWALDIKPPHFDEGINGWFVDQMRSAGFYRYDPENYHGPLYFYILFVFLSLLGRNLWALRLPAVLASIASVWMALRFDRFLGRGAAVIGALALAVSPAAIFYGRYAIHESWMVLSLMITAWGILAVWREGTKRGLIAASLGFTLMLLLKETAMIHIGCFLIAGGVLAAWQIPFPSRPAVSMASPRWRPVDLFWCAALSLLAILFFYSGTFLNVSGVPDFFRAYAKWFQTGMGEGGHLKSEYQLGPLNCYWLSLMGRYEWPSLLGLLYAVRLAWPAPAVTRYLAIYGIGALSAYSLVPYKTPWCIISMLWPFALLFGAALAEGWERTVTKPLRRTILITLGIVLLGGSFAAAVRLNFRHCTDPKEPYVYVQTMPEIAVVTDPLLAMARRSPLNLTMPGQILLESYYPLPWILGEFSSIGYYAKDDRVPLLLDGDFIVALSSQQEMVEGRIRDTYLRRRFHLRDSMEECTVWFREARFKDWFKEPAHGVTDRVVPAGMKKP